MVKNILTLFLVVVSSMVSGQKSGDVIGKAKRLVNEKKYESAFSELNKFDPKNKNPEVFLEKQNIVLNYFVTSMSHKMFSLKDIKPTEDIMDYRGKGESESSLVMFDIGEILPKLISKNPKNYKLNKALADYYFDAMIKYGDNWLISDEELKERIRENYKIAIDNKEGDYMSHFSLGQLFTNENKFAEAIPEFLKSIELKSDYATSNYNLAISYMYNNETENALKYALKAYELYTDDLDYRSDAARLTSQLYLEKKDFDNAVKYIELADKAVPDNYYNLNLMLKLYAETKHADFNKKVDVFFNLAPSNPTIYDDLERIFYEYNAGDKLVFFLNEKKNNKQFDDKTLGTIYFHIAKFSLYNEAYKSVKENALKSKEYFIKVFEKDHQVFGLIDELISKSEK